MTAASRRAGVASEIERAGIVAVVRLNDGAAGRSVCEALAEGGVTAIEITMTVPNAISLIHELAQSTGLNVLIGAGTVLDGPTAERVVQAELHLSGMHLRRIGVSRQGRCDDRRLRLGLR